MTPLAHPIAPIPPDHPFPAEERWRIHAEIDAILYRTGRIGLHSRITKYRRIDEGEQRP